jgi:hypothetical protein
MRLAQIHTFDIDLRVVELAQSQGSSEFDVLHLAIQVGAPFVGPSGPPDDGWQRSPSCRYCTQSHNALL